MSKAEKEVIRIVFLGDKNVGKSSIISACVSEDSSAMIDALKEEKSNSVLYPVLLRSETSLSNYDTILVDTFGGETDKNNHKATIQSAQSIILVYDLTDPKSYIRLKEYWLPQIKEYNSKCTIIIQANKQDIAKLDEDVYEKTKVKKTILPILRDFAQVELGLECSAKARTNIIEALYCAQCVYLFPQSPQYIHREKDQTDKYKKTLTTIFRILDKDKDGFLSDNELNSIQEFVFSANLSKDDIRGIKDIIEEEQQNVSNKKGVTQEGFFIINKRMIEMMKVKNCWMIIKKFQFNEKLELVDPGLNDTFPELSLGRSVELSNDTEKFLKSMFNLFSGDGHNLKFSEMKQIFYPIESEVFQYDWDNLINISYDWENAAQIKNDSSYEKIQVPYESWIMYWDYLANEDYSKCYSYLRYIGFNGKLNEAMFLTNRTDNLRDMANSNSERNVIKVVLIGEPNIGKTSLIRSQCNNNFQAKSLNTHAMFSKISYYNNKKFIFKEIPTEDIESYFQDECNIVPNKSDVNISSSNIQNKSSDQNKRSNSKKAFTKSKTNQICVIGENQVQLLAYLMNHFNKIPSGIPKIGILTKSDLRQLESAMMNSRAFDKYGISQVCECSSISGETKEVSYCISDILRNPEKGLTIEEIKESQQRHNQVSSLTKVAVPLFGGIALAGQTYYIIYKYRLNKNELKK